MQFLIDGFEFNLTKKRMIATNEANESSYQFTSEGEVLLVKALNAAIQSSFAEGGSGKTVPLQGLVDLTAKTIHIGSLGSVRHDRDCADESMLCFTEEPMFEHKKPGLFELGQYSPRIESYQRRYSRGPTAHQQLLFRAVQKPQVSADDAADKRGFAILIQVTGNTVSFIVDGNSLSINETAQYLRTLHEPNHELTDAEAKNDVLKASKKYSAACEDWILENLVRSCEMAIRAHESKLCTSRQCDSAPLSRSLTPQ